jgi:hypothetical protein
VEPITWNSVETKRLTADMSAKDWPGIYWTGSSTWARFGGVT